MPACRSCQKALQGTWTMTEDASSYKETGRYLGISDGYFLYNGSPHWVYCYCSACWQKEVLALGIVTADVNSKTAALNQTIATLTKQNADLKTELNAKTVEAATLKTQSTTANQTIENLNKEIASLKPNASELQLLKSTSKELQNLSTISKDLQSLKSVATELQTFKTSLSESSASLGDSIKSLRTQVTTKDKNSSDLNCRPGIHLDWHLYDKIHSFLQRCQQKIADYDGQKLLQELNRKLESSFAATLESEWKSSRTHISSVAQQLFESLEKEHKKLEMMLQVMDSELPVSKPTAQPAEFQQMIETTRLMKKNSSLRMEAIKKLKAEADDPDTSDLM